MKKKSTTKTIKKIVLISGFIICSFLVGIVVLNFVYMSGSIDFYKPELTAFNSGNDLSDGNDKDTILIMGDSFTAGNSYVDILRYMYPHYRIINSGISGTGIIQADIIGKKRTKRFKPKVFIYQIYAGNDLFDITYPVNWKNISFARNLYWSIANNVRVVAYMNYRYTTMRNLKNITYKEYKPSNAHYINDEKFSVQRYKKIYKIYNRADDELIEDSILLKGKKKEDFDILVARLNELLDELLVDCNKAIVVVPHMAQLSKVYLDRTVQLGAAFSEPDKALAVDYPFLRQLREQFPDVFIINPLMALRKAEEEGIEVYYTDNVHFNMNGNKVLAESIASYLKDQTIH